MKAQGSKREILYVILAVMWLTVIGVNSPAFKDAKINSDMAHSSVNMVSTPTNR
jgi:hypothetical protein